MTASASVTAGAVDAKLLDMLKANGSITEAQHAELTADLAREARAEKRADKQKLDKEAFTSFQQLANWTTTTQLRGDVRARNDYINIEDEPTFAVPPPGGTTPDVRDKHRQRLRARLGAFTQVNAEVETGIQIATGNSPDRRSTNQDLDNYFDKKTLWLDLAYIDYHPVAVPGLKLFAGKMKQPWTAVGDIAWDGDINPEGLAASYTRKWGTTTLFGSTGYMVLRDNVDGDGVQWSNDLSLYTGQLGVSFDAGAKTRLMLGASINEFHNENQASPITVRNPVVALRANGNTTDLFRLWELFGQLDVIGLPLPLTLYGQYVTNSAARDLTVTSGTTTTVFRDGDDDTAWLLGLRTNVAGAALDYTYRDVEANGVVGSLTDSDFASGFTDSSGHKLKGQYDFGRNFNLTVSWFLAESDAASRFRRNDADVETLMIDLNAKF